MNICVFSSSSNAIPEIYFNEAKQLGALIAKEGHTLINGGANVGLMEAITISARKAGAKTIGIIPERFIGRSLKSKMREISDAFIALPGGFGTLEEILEVITLKQLDYHSKPVIIVNTNNFYKHLFMQLEVAFKEMFAKSIYKELFRHTYKLSIR